MKTYTLLIALLLVFSFSKAQEPDLSNEIITWNCSKVTDHDNSNVVTQSSDIVSGPNSLKWIQTSLEQEFTVIGRTWNWQDGSGTITYQVQLGTASGTVQIQNNTIEVDVTGSDFTVDLTFDVTDYSY